MSLERIGALLDAMRPLLRHGQWNELEAVHREVATRLCGEELTRRIGAVDLGSYERALADGLSKAIAAARQRAAKAVYFEYNLDNRWESHFFVCSVYAPESAGDDDWACDYESIVAGPEQRELAKIYTENPGFFDPDDAMGATVYMVARTVAAFGRACSHVATDGLALCIGFHDQDPIQRIKETAA